MKGIEWDDEDGHGERKCTVQAKVRVGQFECMQAKEKGSHMQGQYTQKCKKKNVYGKGNKLN